MSGIDELKPLSWLANVAERECWPDALRDRRLQILERELLHAFDDGCVLEVLAHGASAVRIRVLLQQGGQMAVEVFSIPHMAWCAESLYPHSEEGWLQALYEARSIAGKGLEPSRGLQILHEWRNSVVKIGVVDTLAHSQPGRLRLASVYFAVKGIGDVGVESQWSVAVRAVRRLLTRTRGDGSALWAA